MLWKFEVPWIGSGALRRIKLVPFVASGGAGVSTLREVVANIVFFVPFGLYLGLLAPNWGWKAVGVIASASAAVEVLQYALAVGSSDITDVMTNTLGGLAGIAMSVVIGRRLQARTTTVMAWTCLIATVLALLAVAMFLASGVRYGPLRAA